MGTSNPTKGDEARGRDRTRSVLANRLEEGREDQLFEGGIRRPRQDREHGVITRGCGGRLEQFAQGQELVLVEVPPISPMGQIIKGTRRTCRSRLRLVGR